MYIYVYIYIYICVCVCVYVCTLIIYKINKYLKSVFTLNALQDSFSSEKLVK